MGMLGNRLLRAMGFPLNDFKRGHSLEIRVYPACGTEVALGWGGTGQGHQEEEVLWFSA